MSIDKISEEKLLNYTISIQQDYIQNKSPTHILNSILEAIIDITGSNYGFIVRVTDEHFIPIATSGINCVKKTINAASTLSENFKFFMKQFEGVKNSYEIKYIPISNGEIIGLISFNNINKFITSKHIFDPLLLICKSIIQREQFNRIIELEKGSLLFYIGRKLKTPITNIFGSLILLKKATSEDIKKEYLQLIEQSNNELVSIVNNTIDYSRLLIDNIKLEYSKLNIEECIDDAIKIVQCTLNKKNIEISYGIKQDVPNIINLDIIRFKQVLINSLMSIIRISKTGAYIDILLEKKNSTQLCIIIRVKKGDVDRIRYNLSNKLDPLITPDCDIDLGMQIVKKIMYLFKGSVNLCYKESDILSLCFNVELSNSIEKIKECLQGKNCIIISNNIEQRIAFHKYLKKLDINNLIFTNYEEASYFIEPDKITLVLTNMPVPEYFKQNLRIIMNIDGWRIDNIVKNINNKLTIDKLNIRILLIEDNQNNQQIIMEFLDILNWKNYKYVDDGKEAIDILEKEKFDIVLIDIDTNDIPVLFKIHENKKIKTPYIIALTTYIENIKYYKKYIQDTIIKPITNSRTIENVLQKAVLYL